MTALANDMVGKLAVDETALLASIFVQLGDTLDIIATRENLCADKNKIEV